MADLELEPTWEPGIYQLEYEDPVEGGPDGIDNMQAKQLGRRTEWLKAQLPFVNAKQYGLKADGVTDDTAALQAAVSTGHNVILPKGHIKVTGPIYLKSDQTVCGMGNNWSGTVIKLMGDFTLFDCRSDNNAIAAKVHTRVQLSDFKIISDVSVPTARNSFAIDMTGGYMNEVRNVSFGDGGGGYGFGIDIDGTAHLISNCRFLKSSTTGGKYAIRAKSGSITVHNCQFERDYDSQTGSKLEFQDAMNVRLFGCHFEYSGIAFKNVVYSAIYRSYTYQADLTVDQRSHHNIFEMEGTAQTQICDFGWANTYRNCQAANIGANVQEFTIGGKVSPIRPLVVSDVFNAAYRHKWGRPGDVLLFIVHVRNRLNLATATGSIRFIEANNTANIIEQSGEVTLASSGVGVVGDVTGRGGYTYWAVVKVPTGAENGIYIDFTGANCELDVWCSKAVNLNGTMETADGWGVDPAGPVYSTPTNATPAMVGAQYTVTPTAAGVGWSVIQTLVLEEGMDYLFILKGRWTSNAVSLSPNSAHNGADGAQYISVRLTDDFDHDPASQFLADKCVYFVHRASTSVVYVSFGSFATANMDGATKELDWCVVVPLRPAPKQPKTRTVAAAGTGTTHDDVILLTGGAYTFTLPSAQEVERLVLKDAAGNAGTNNKTIAAAAGQTIDGAATYVMAVDRESLTLISDGANWHLI